MTDTDAPNSRQGSTTYHVLPTSAGDLNYTASAQWQTLYENDKPVVDLFHVAYTITDQATVNRPITFVFNGGPGAASAYLHMGGLGPKRVAFNADGSLPKPPVQVVDNAETWLTFTDLVFIDPVGTGFSRALPKDDDNGSKSDSKPVQKEPNKTQSKKFWTMERDLKALGEFIRDYLSANNRWLSPVFIAGESYGGFRVAKLARILQQDYGVGLNGAVIISPVLEFETLFGTDYTLTGWALVVPAMAATAVHHGRVPTTDTPAEHASQAELFARQTLLPFLAMGDLAPPEERQRVYEQLAELIGLPLEVVQRQRGRIDIAVFARELLRDRDRILGLYDASVTAIDPFPDRLLHEGCDPTLDGVDRLFTGAINSHLRSTLGVETSLAYHLLSYEVFKAWRFFSEEDYGQGYVGAVDDLRVGMTLNPHLQVAINHGIFDLVTPYFASNFLADLMALHPDLRPNLSLSHYKGGHMFYTWDESRQQWLAAMQEFYEKALT